MKINGHSKYGVFLKQSYPQFSSTFLFGIFHPAIGVPPFQETSICSWMHQVRVMVRVLAQLHSDGFQCRDWWVVASLGGISWESQLQIGMHHMVYLPKNNGMKIASNHGQSWSIYHFLWILPRSTSYINWSMFFLGFPARGWWPSPMTPKKYHQPTCVFKIAAVFF